MRPKRNTAVQSCLLLSALVHAAVVGVYLLLSLLPARDAAGTPEALEVYQVSPEELAELSPQLPQYATQDMPNTDAHLTPEQLAALPRDPELLPPDQDNPAAPIKARGQIVELADPARPQEAPEDAEYLSRANHRVDQETAAVRYRLNPQVVAPTFSEKSSQARLEQGEARARLEGAKGQEAGPEGRRDGEKLASLSPRKAAETPATTAGGAPVAPSGAASSPPLVRQPVPPPITAQTPVAATGTQPMLTAIQPRDLLVASAARNPERGRGSSGPGSEARDVQAGVAQGQAKGEGRKVALFPERYRYGTGQGGGDDGSAPVQLQQGDLRGSPASDRLKEKAGTATMLNARELRYAAYYQRISRQVLFYWDQALGNISADSVRLTRTEYTTTVYVVLDRRGGLKSVTLLKSCGVRPLDDAVVKAFQLAAPFAPPPAELVSVDGEAELPNFGFTVPVGNAEPRYTGVDPRASVRFPGIVWPN